MNASQKPDTIQAQQWEHGWLEHEQMQFKRLAGLPFAEKLAWLEEAPRVVLQLKSGQSTSRNDDQSSE